jgi:exopolysaccharide biosynthesis polyprenyl glycosylphosphotransferase
VEIGIQRQDPLITAKRTAPLVTSTQPTWLDRRLSLQWLPAPLVALDTLCIGLSMAAAYATRFQFLAYYHTFSTALYRRLALVGIPLWLVIFTFHRLYNPDYLFGGAQEYANIFSACTFGVAALGLYGLLDRSFDVTVSRGWLVIIWFFSVASISLTRFGYRRLIYLLRKRGNFIQRAIIVGTNEEGRAVANQLAATPTAGVQVLGFVEPTDSGEKEIGGLPVITGLRRLYNIIRSLEIDDLIVIPTALHREELLEIYRDLGLNNGARICLSSGLYELFTNSMQVREVGFIPLVSLNRTRITGAGALIKTAFDYVASFLGIVLLGPLFVAVAVLIRRDSPGAIIHRRRVVGLNGRRFDAYKFRTMIPDADSYLESNPELKRQWEEDGKIDNDPRITRIGRFLRRYSIDELPQLFNVLRGEMSLVGPRMITPDELKHFKRWRHNLMTVKPGLTGLWQVSGRADLSYPERVRLDMHYIRNYTIWVDLRILFSTARAVLSGRGAF